METGNVKEDMINTKTPADLELVSQPAFRGTRGKCRTAGFSLIEMVLTIAIALVLLAMGVPKLQSAISNYQLTGAVNSASWEIQATRYQAIMNGYPYELAFSAANNTYQVSNDNAWPGTVTFANVGTAVPITSARVVISAPTTFQFKPNGTVSAVAGAMTFTITYQGITRTLTVSNYGSVTVQ